MSEILGEHLADEELDAYLDEELRPERLVQATAHLNACAACQGRLERLGALFTVVESLPEVPLGRDLSGPVVSAVSLPQSWPQRLRTIAVIQLLAALTLVAVIWNRVSTAFLLLDLNALNEFAGGLLDGIVAAASAGWQSVWGPLADAAVQLRNSYLDLSLPGIQAPILWGAVLAALMLGFAGNGVLLLRDLRPNPKE